MRSTLAGRFQEGFRRALRGEEGSCGRVLVSWTLAGGVAGGGMLVGMLTLTGVVSPGFQLLAAPALFVLGSFLGLVHGFGLALAGRPAAWGTGRVVRRVAFAVLLALPALFFAWLVTAAISVTAAVVAAPKVSYVVLAGLGWVVGGALCYWAAVEGWRAGCRAVARMPWLRTTCIAAAASVPALVWLLVTLRPRVWGTDIHLNGAGAVGLALALAAWVVLPVASLFFRALPPAVIQHPYEREAGT